jgi:hypothetical protein
LHLLFTGKRSRGVRIRQRSIKYLPVIYGYDQAIVTLPSFGVSHNYAMRPLYLAERVCLQRPRQPGEKVYSLHAPEAECIGKGKAHRAYEFGVKVSVATSLHRSADGQLVAHIKSRPEAPCNGHTLAALIPEKEQQPGRQSIASSSTGAIAAITPLQHIRLKFISPVRNAASQTPSNVSCIAGLLSNP